jgi:hypothetical protein
VVVRLVTYVVVEIPVLSSALRPQTTAARVTAFAAWLDANKIRAAAALASVIGVALIRDEQPERGGGRVAVPGRRAAWSVPAPRRHLGQARALRVAATR